MRSLLILILVCLTCSAQQGPEDILLKKKSSRFTVVAPGTNNPPVFDNVMHVYHFSEPEGSSRFDTRGTLTLFETGGSVPTNSAGIYGISTSVHTTHTLTSTNTISLAFPFTFSCWAKVNNVSGVLWNFGVNGCRFNATGTYSLRAANSGAAITGAASTGILHLFVLSADGTVQTLYVDAVAIGTNSCTVADADTVLSLQGTGTSGAVCDELVWWQDKSLNQVEVSNLWNTSLGVFYRP